MTNEMSTERPIEIAEYKLLTYSNGVNQKRSIIGLPVVNGKGRFCVSKISA